MNGSLEDWLHPKPSHGADGSSDAPRNLNVSQRLDIAIDVAFALEYLHHHSGAPVVHCDLKPSNVLLDNELVAHVGDFGLAKFLSIGITATCANQLSSVGVRGTIGYAPPGNTSKHPPHPQKKGKKRFILFNFMPSHSEYISPPYVHNTRKVFYRVWSGKRAVYTWRHIQFWDPTVGDVHRKEAH